MKQQLTDILALPQLNAAWQGESPPDRLSVTGWSTDSRRIKAGEGFVAVRGEKFDGHEYALQALEQGAVAAMVSNTWFTQTDLPDTKPPLITVPDTLKAYQEIARHHRNQFNAAVVALTGSSGKTTTKEMIYSVLSRRYHVLRNIKSYNNHIGVPATLLQMNKKHEIAVLEMGTSNFGEIERLSALARPDICVLLNIGFAHLQNLRDLDGVCQAKLEICSHANPQGTVIFNADDQRLAAQSYPVSMQAGFGIDSKNGYTAEDLACDERGCYSFSFMNSRIKLPLPGRHNVYNALAAAVVGVRFCVPVQDIKAGLESLSGIQDRMQVEWTEQGVLMNDVYNSNPGSCLAAMRTAKDIHIPKGGRRIAVLADMLELGEFAQPEHEKLARRAKENGFDLLLLYGKETRHTAKAAQTAGIETRHFEDQTALIKDLLKHMEPDDLVLIKGSRSMHMENVVKALKH